MTTKLVEYSHVASTYTIVPIFVHEKRPYFQTDSGFVWLSLSVLSS